MPQKMRVSSHREYNKFLEKRGNTFHFGIKTKIPSKNNAAEHPKLDYMLDKNAAIQLMKLYGENSIKRWKEEVNYGKDRILKDFSQGWSEYLV